MPQAEGSASVKPRMAEFLPNALELDGRSQTWRVEGEPFGRVRESCNASSTSKNERLPKALIPRSCIETQSPHHLGSWAVRGHKVLEGASTRLQTARLRRALLDGFSVWYFSEFVPSSSPFPDFYSGRAGGEELRRRTKVLDLRDL